ncbi:MAG TPA: protein phosphatase 2C domain-containing protein [Candidatus Polarisedimenticolaceae bacterium]|nr:protein phosphatase 2C domain-containing protein [Candidatus Polarisedimenticolaceae bacterium]
MSDPSDQDTIPPPLRSTALGHDEVWPPKPLDIVQVDAFGITDQGKVRQDNQDHFYLGQIGRFSRVLATSLPPGELPERMEQANHVAVVADGMGGHKGGEVASRTAIIVFFHLLFDTTDWVLRVDDKSAQRILDRAGQRYRSLDELLDERARIDPNLQGMGTTMTLTYSIGYDLFLAHCGDSRAYLCRSGRLEQLTRDHTRVQEMVDLGVMSREEAATHKLRNVLTNVLGGGVPLTDVDLHRVKLAPGDAVLLCSDGLYDVVKDEEIASILSTVHSAQAACRALIDLALDRNAPDNVTVVVSRYAAR